ncbi:YcaO-like family protein [Actinomyces sp. oral taxon 448]|jgi:putative fatty acid binding protein|uniref:YcaO-like family protein n=1 Tax=Actinomyces sp. oral taxon 448 TaxID=712124 RepID=UPI00021897A0|nr:YcaO-like family protein [Actinomyces sp. oral taxon 448]EGQ75532.1 SagD family bacteriocin biosynthesis protein [Actinomyces sp. oral taxon 448 str. F0400]
MTNAVASTEAFSESDDFAVMPNPRYRYVERNSERSIAVLADHDLREIKGDAARILRACLTGEMHDLISGDTMPLAAAYGAVELLRRLGILVDEYPVARLGDRFPDASSFPRRTHVIDLLGSQDLVAALSRALVGLQPGINVDIVLVDDYKARACRRALDEAGARGDAVAFGALVDNRLFVGPFAPAGSGVLDDLIFALRFNDRAAQIGGSVLRSPLPLDRIRKTATPFALTMREQLDEWFTRGHCRAEEAIIELVEIGSGRRVHPIRRQPHSQDVAPATEAIPLDLRTRGTDAIGRSVSTADFLERNAHLLSDVTGVVRELERLDDPNDPDSPAHVYVAGHNWALRTDDPAVLRRSLRGQSGGKGRTDAQARAGGLAEAVERHSAIAVGRERRRRARFTDLPSAVHPNAVQLFSDRQFASREERNRANDLYNYIPEPFEENALVDFTPVWNPVDGSTAWMLTALCYFMFPNAAASPGSVDGVGRRFARADSNGYAAGATRADAAFQGLAELIERDAVALWWYNRVRRPAVDLESLDDDYLRSTKRWLDTLERDLWLLDLTTDIGVPVVGAVSPARDGGACDQILLGFGAHTDVRQAAVRAVAEVLQFRASIPPEVWHRPDAGRPSGGEAIEWLTRARLAQNPHLVPDSSAARTPACSGSSPTVEYLIERVTSTGTPVYLLDATRDDVGVPVVRAIAPGLRPWWSRLADGRLYEVPVALGWRETRMEEQEANPIAMFF